jgi:hypothetical protein
MKIDSINIVVGIIAGIVTILTGFISVFIYFKNKTKKPKSITFESSNNQNEKITEGASILLHEVGSLWEKFMKLNINQDRIDVLLSASITEFLINEFVQSSYTNIIIPQKFPFAKTISNVSDLHRGIVTIVDTQDIENEAISLFIPFFKEIGLYKKIGTTDLLEFYAEIVVDTKDDLVKFNKYFGRYHVFLDSLFDEWIPFYVALKLGSEVDVNIGAMKNSLRKWDSYLVTPESKIVINMLNKILGLYRYHNISEISLKEKDKACSMMKLINNSSYTLLSNNRKLLGFPETDVYDIYQQSIENILKENIPNINLTRVRSKIISPSTDRVLSRKSHSELTAGYIPIINNTSEIFKRVSKIKTKDDFESKYVIDESYKIGSEKN